MWKGVSQKYAEGVTGDVNVIQTSDKLWDQQTIWHTQERDTLLSRQADGLVGDINISVLNNSGEAVQLPASYVDTLLYFE